ncbi:MAG: class B sortase [Christensenellaceae bacterium]|nr:class B sortase [Christensenellaceae bacterium]
MNTKRFLILLLTITLLFGFACSAAKEETEAYGTAQVIIPERTVSETESVSTPVPTVPLKTPAPDMLPEMAEYYAQNNDVVGKLTIEDTVIDYLVMYSGDDYYINHNFYKNYQRSGCLYIDKYCTVDPRDTNLLIHGHNMKSGIMFGALDKYLDEDYYKDHKYITYTTLYEVETYEVFAVFVSQVFKKTDTVFKYYNFHNAETELEYNKFVNNCRALSVFDTGVIPEFGDQLLTLSTCDYSKEDGRMVVVARKISE